MPEERIPEPWIGSEAVAVILHGWLDEEDKRRGITAWKHKIVIEQIHELGIVARTPASKDPALRFYP